MPTPASRLRPAESAHVHESHKDVVNRLRRASGISRPSSAWSSPGGPALDIAQQMHAVIRAVEGAKSTLIHDHIEHCLEDAMGPASREQRASIEEFKKISRYL